MRSLRGRRRFRTSTLAAAVAVIAGCTTSPKQTADRPAGSADSASSPISVGTEVMVSVQDSLVAHNEYMADIDPEHPERLVACDQPFVPALNERKNSLFTSFDGGKTWTLAKEDRAARGGLIAGDPVCMFGLGGTALFLTLVQDETEGFGKKSGSWEAWPTGIGQRVYRSTDGGRTWPEPTVIGFIDNQNLLVDRSGGRYHGRIYLHGNVSGGHPFWLVYSTDSGKTFKRSEQTKVKGRRWTQFDRGTLLPDGTLLIPYESSDEPNPRSPNAPPRNGYAVARSTNGGERLSPPDTVIMSRPSCEEHAFPQMAADHSNGPFRGRAYFLFGEKRDAGFRGNEGVAPRCAYMISTSDDSGKTWTPPVQVTDAPYRPGSEEGPDARLAAMAVNKDGVVGLTWYDRREDPKNRSARLRFSASLDGGDTWLPSVAVSSQPFAIDGARGIFPYARASGGGHKERADFKTKATDIIETPLNPGARQGTGSMGGDYSQLVANPNGAFHAFWVDNRGNAGRPAQIYTTTVTVPGPVQRNGSAELAELDNVTSKVEVQYRSLDATWDGDYLNYSLGVVLLNVSKDTIAGPLKYRILGVQSPLGTVVVRSSGAEAAGTAFDMTTSLPAGGLAPDSTTTPFVIELRAGPLPRALADAGLERMGSFNAKVLGRVKRR